jgi:hypothetical protein
MVMSDRWNPTVLEAKRLCLGVILQALHDLFHPPAVLGTYSCERGWQDGRRRVLEVEMNRGTAQAFFFDDDSPFVWMAESLGVDLEAARATLQEEIRSGKVSTGYRIIEPSD